MSAKKTAENTAKGFTAEEKAAMKERARELKAESRAKRKREDGERDLLEKIAEMPESDRVIAERIHAIVTANARSAAEAWYGTAYANQGQGCLLLPGG